MSFESDVKLDKYNIDKEVQRQPGLVGEYAKEEAQAKSEKDRLEAQLKQLKGRRYLDFIANSAKKPTGDQLNAMVACDEDVVALEGELLDAKRELNDWSAGLKAIEDKSSQIKNLKDLMVSGIIKS